MLVTNREVVVDATQILNDRGIYEKKQFVVPKGTRVVKFAHGGSSRGYAVASVEDTIKCGMDAWNAKYHYLFVPADAVSESA